MRTRSSRRHTLVLGIAATALLAACGGSDSGSDGGATTTPTDVDLVMTGNSRNVWEERDVTATAGEVTIELRNVSTVEHNLYIVDSEGNENPTFLESKRGGDNPVKTVTLDAGTYTLLCKIAGHTDMKARLTVT